MRKIRGDKPTGIIIYTYIEMSQGNSLYSDLYLKLKCHVFCFIFPLLSPTKLENMRVGQILPRGRDNTSRRGEMLQKGIGR
jgi:hypothetical protein